jgi:hypothetical protein
VTTEIKWWYASQPESRVTGIYGKWNLENLVWLFHCNNSSLYPPDSPRLSRLDRNVRSVSQPRGKRDSSVSSAYAGGIVQTKKYLDGGLFEKLSSTNAQYTFSLIALVVGDLLGWLKVWRKKTKIFQLKNKNISCTTKNCFSFSTDLVICVTSKLHLYETD